METPLSHEERVPRLQVDYGVSEAIRAFGLFDRQVCRVLDTRGYVWRARQGEWPRPAVFGRDALLDDLRTSHPDVFTRHNGEITESSVDAAEEAFESVDASVKWLSIEPMLEPLEFRKLENFQWLVIGGASSSNVTPEWRVPLEWWLPLHDRATELGLKVYHKSNLFRRSLGFPGSKDPQPKLPDVFRYLKDKTKSEVTLGER